MSIGKPSLIPANFSEGIGHFRPSESKALIFPAEPSPMWRNCAKQAFWRTRSCRLSSQSSSPASRHFLQKSPESNFPNKLKSRPFELVPGLTRGDVSVRSSDFGNLRNPSRFSVFCPRGFSSVAEAVSSSTDVEEDVLVDEDFQELMQDVGKEEKRRVRHWQQRRLAVARGMGQSRYEFLKKRQVKIETEAWEKAAAEYRELLMDMCSKKLAPNLPYMKSLFLGWFEPLRNAIEQEQELYREGKKRTMCSPYFAQLSPDMMAVITMHKLTGLLMSRDEYGIARVVQASLLIGDAIEQEN